MLKGAAEVRSGCCVVDNERQPSSMCDFGKLCEIRDYTSWVAKRLAIDGLGVVINVSEAYFPTKLLELSGELGHRASIQLLCRHEVVASIHEVGEADHLGCVAAGNGKC